MNTGAFGENFPYSNFHDLNMDWIVKIAKDFLDQYTHIQEVITAGEESIESLTDEKLGELDSKYSELETLLNQWYTEHSEDIAQELTTALQDLNTWYNNHLIYLNQYVADSVLQFSNAADNKAAEAIESIPADYTSLSNTVNGIKNDIYKNYGTLEFLMYSDWTALVNQTPANLPPMGSNMRFAKGILKSIKINNAQASPSGNIYIVEVEKDSNNVIRYTDVPFTTTTGVSYVDVNVNVPNDFYVFVKSTGMLWINTYGTYKAGTFNPGSTSVLTFPDNIQFALGFVVTRVDDDTLTDSIYTEIFERSYDNWAYLTSGSSGVWGTNKKYDPGFIKGIRLKSFTSGGTATVYIIPIERNNTRTSFKAYSFTPGLGINDIPINEFITYPFYVFTSVSVAYYTNPGDNIYRSGTYNGLESVSAFDATYPLAIGVIRDPAMSVNDYWRRDANIPVLGICPRHIILLGDSIVQGYGISDYATCEKVEFPIAPALEVYPSLSHEELISNNTWGMKLKTHILGSYDMTEVDNYGIGGLNTGMLEVGYSTYIDDSVTDVIISIGTNDTSASDKREAITNPLIRIINNLKAQRINIIILTNTPQINQGTAYDKVCQMPSSLLMI